MTLVTDHLKKPLEDYINKLPKVRLLRAGEKSGLIRARLLGFESCTAPVAVFLDSHCEVVEGMALFVLMLYCPVDKNFQR